MILKQVQAVLSIVSQKIQYFEANEEDEDVGCISRIRAWISDALILNQSASLDEEIEEDDEDRD